MPEVLEESQWGHQRWGGAKLQMGAVKN